MVVLIDFDKYSDRLTVAQARIPERLRNRVFILGSWSEPEELKQELSCSHENLGWGMAQDCREELMTWGHELWGITPPKFPAYAKHVRPALCEEGTSMPTTGWMKAASGPQHWC